MIHRKLPLPEHFNNPTPGICRWCNLPIQKKLKNGNPSRSTWHQSCVNEYKFYHWPAYTRRIVWKRDKGKCNLCNHQCDRKGTNGWDMDHIIPLHLANYEKWAWELNNLQTLCKPCHKKKTATEARDRAIKRNPDKY